MPFSVDDGRIAAAEKALGRRLPDGLRGRLRQENGGEIEAAGIVWYLHPIFDDSDRGRLRRTATSNVVHETQEARAAFEVLFPEGAIVIANDGGGDYLLLLSDENEPRWWEPRTTNDRPSPPRTAPTNASSTAHSPARPRSAVRPPGAAKRLSIGPNRPYKASANLA